MAVALVLAASCTTAPPLVTHTVHRYSVAGPGATGAPVDFHPGDTLPLVWKATPQEWSGAASDEKARLCVAVVGPYSDVVGLKASHVPARSCPIGVPGIVVATDVAVADLLVGAPVDQSLVLPSTLAPGYYDVLSVAAYGTSDTGDAVATAGILHVVGAP